MTKSELIQILITKYPGLPAEDLENTVNVVLEEIAQTLQEGGRVELRGFGIFSVRERQARQGRNPRTGEVVSVPPKKVPFFKTGKELRERVNEA